MSFAKCSYCDSDKNNIVLSYACGYRIRYYCDKCITIEETQEEKDYWLYTARDYKRRSDANPIKPYKSFDEEREELKKNIKSKLELENKLDKYAHHKTFMKAFWLTSIFWAMLQATIRLITYLMNG